MNTNTKQVIHREILTAPGADNVSAETTLALPKGAMITKAEFSTKGVAIYVVKATHHKPTDRKFLVVQTGVEVPGDAAFIATVSLPSMAALHVFELLA